MRKLLSWKKLVLIALCVAMVFTLVACGDKNEQNGGGVSVENNDFGILVDSSKVGSTLEKVAYALFPDSIDNNGTKVNLGFNADMSIGIDNAIENLNVDFRLSLDRQNSEKSAFSLEVRKNSAGAPFVFCAYYANNSLELDLRGINRGYYIVDTDISYIINLIATAMGKENIFDSIDDITKMIPTILPILGEIMVNDGVLKVYSKPNMETKTEQITSTIYVKELVKYAVDLLKGKGIVGGNIVESIKGMIGEENINNVISVMEEIYRKIPNNSTINLGLGVIGAGKKYSVVNSSLDISVSKFNASILSNEFAINSVANVKEPMNRPDNVKQAYLGSLCFDIGLGVKMTEGKITVADIDKAMGGILNSLVSGLDEDIDFSNSVINVKDNISTELRLSVGFQLNLKDNNKTNFLIEIYINKDGKDGNSSEDDSLIQIYYVGEKQAIYLDLSGLGHTSTLPNKLRISKDLNGNPINFTKMINDAITSIIANKDGGADLTGFIARIVDMVGDDSAKSSADDEKIAEINDKFMTGELSIPVFTAEDGGSEVDVMSLVAIILKELQFDYGLGNDGVNKVFYGITMELTADIFEDMLVSQLKQFGVTDLEILAGITAKLGIHITPDEGLVIGLDVAIDANSGDTDYPTFAISAKAKVDIFTSLDTGRLPQDDNKSQWQELTLVKSENEDGKIDLFDSILKTIAGKKVYFSAAASFAINLEESRDTVDIGSILDKTIGGAIGNALADLQLRTGRLNVEYVLRIEANLDLASFIGLDTTDEVIKILEKVIGEQDVLITLNEKKSNTEVLSLFLTGGNLYVDAEKLGIPRTVIDAKTVFEAVDGLLSSRDNNVISTADGETNKALVTVLVVLSQIDALTIMENEIALALNSSLLNVLIPMLLPDIKTSDLDALTMSYIGANIKFDDDSLLEDGIDASEYAGLLNSITIKLNLGVELGGIGLDVAVAIGGLNIGLVDNSGNADYQLYTKYFSNKSTEDFTNPLKAGMLTFGMQGELNLKANGEFTFNGKEMDGEFGAILSNLALVLGADNLNKTFILKLNAGIDLVDFENNKSQIALQILSKENDDEEVVVAGIYYYENNIYIDIPNLFKRFSVKCDLFYLIDFIIEKIQEKNPSESSALATADEGVKNELSALTSIIQLGNGPANIRLSAQLLKGIAVVLVGSFTESTDPSDPPELDVETGNEIIDVIQTLPFDIVAELSISGTTISDFDFGLNIYIAENLIREDSNGNVIVDKDGTTLGIKLGNLHVDYVNRKSVLPEIEKAFKTGDMFADSCIALESLDNIDEKVLLKDAKISLDLDATIRVTANGYKLDAESNEYDDVLLYLNKIINTLPQVLIRIGAMEEGHLDLANMNIHLAVSANVGAILAGEYSNALSLSLGIYKSEFRGYDESANDKLLSVVILPTGEGDDAKYSAYIDCNGLNNKLVNGKIKLDGIDLEDIVGKISNKNIGEEGKVETTASDDSVKLNGIVSIINKAVQQITLTNSGLVIGLGENIIGMIVGLIGDADENAEFPLTEGSVTLLTKDYTDSVTGVQYKAGIHANIGLKGQATDKSIIELGIGLSNLHIAFEQLSGNFLHESNFDANEFYSIKELKQLNVSLNLGIDVDFNSGSQKLNLNSYVGGLIGNLQYLAGQNQSGIDFVVDENGALKDLHLNIIVQGRIGIKNYDETEIKVLLKLYESKADRIADSKGEPVVGNVKNLLSVYLVKDVAYFSSDILNITDFKISNVGVNDFIGDKVNSIIDTITDKLSFGESAALATEGTDTISDADFLIGNKKVDIIIGSALVQAILELAITDNDGLLDTLNKVVADIFNSLEIDVDLNTMRAGISISILKDGSAVKDPNKTNNGLITLGIDISGFNIDVINQKTIVTNDELTDIDKYEEAVTNAFVELEGYLSVKRDALTKDKEIIGGADSIFGKLAGVVNKIGDTFEIDAKTLDLINGLLQDLYIGVINDNDDGAGVTLKALVQANIDWQNWYKLDLYKSSFRLKLSSVGKNADGSEVNNTIVDIYLIGNENRLYIDAPFLRDEGVKVTVGGINIIRLIEKMIEEKNQPLATADDTNGTIGNVFAMINEIIGGVKFGGDGMGIGFAPTFLNGVARILGLIPSMEDWVEDIKNVVSVFPDSRGGIYIDYAKTDEDAKLTSPTIKLKYGLVGIGDIELGLNHYAVGVVNNPSAVDVENNYKLPFKKDEFDGIQNLRNFTGTGYKDIADYKNIQVSFLGEISASVVDNKDLDLSTLVKEIFASFIPVTIAKDLGVFIKSNAEDEAKLAVKLEANLDITNIVDGLQIGATIYKSGVEIVNGRLTDTNNKEGRGEVTDNSILIAIYYDKGSLMMKAPDYIEGNKVVMFGNVKDLINDITGGIGLANDEADSETVNSLANAAQASALINIIFGKQYFSAQITGEIFGILVQILQGMDINLSENAFAALKDKFNLDITVGSLDVDGKLSIADLYASIGIGFGPIQLGIRLQEPVVNAITNDSIVPSEWLDENNQVKLYNVTFKLGAEGKIGLKAGSGTINLDKLLKGFGMDTALGFDAILGDNNQPGKNAIDLQLGIKIDAELCIGMLEKNRIGVRLYAIYTDANGTEVETQVAGIFLDNKEIFIDLKNEVINLTQLRISSNALEQIIALITGSMTAVDNNNQTSALATTDTTTGDVVKDAKYLSNLILINFNKVEGEGAKGLGSITAEVGADIINVILRYLNLDDLVLQEGESDNPAVSIKIDMPYTDENGNVQSNFGIGVNVDLDFKHEQGEDPIIPKLGLSLWLGNVYIAGEGEQAEAFTQLEELKSSKDTVTLEELSKKYVNLDITVQLSMMKSMLDNSEDEDKITDQITIQNPITDFFRGFTPWMKDFLAQLDIIDDKPLDWDNFLSSHSVRIQGNICLGLIINNKTCEDCGTDFSDKNEIYVKHGQCPNPECNGKDNIIPRSFFLEEIDAGITFNRITAKKNENGELEKDEAGNIIIESQTPLLGVYIQNSEIFVYGKPFGINNYKLDKASVDGIANAIKLLLNEGLSANGALSTANGNTVDEGGIDILGIVGALLKQVYISMYCVRVVFENDILSYIPDLTKYLGIEGFPESDGYPTLNDNNYVEIGLINGEKHSIDLSLKVNLDMFGILTRLEIGDLDIGLGNKVGLYMPDDMFDENGELKDTQYLDDNTSILDISFETELKLELCEANTSLKELVGGLIGDIDVGYINQEYFFVDLLLKIRAQIDIKTGELRLGVDIVRQLGETTKSILGIAYDSSTGTAYLSSAIIPSIKVTGIKLDELLGKISGTGLSTEGSEREGKKLVRPILNPGLLEDATNNPGVKVTIAMQQYMAVVITGELINTVIRGIDINNDIPLLPDFELGIKAGKIPMGDGFNDPLALMIEAGIKGVTGVGANPNDKDFLIKLSAGIFLGPIMDNTGKDIYGGTYINFIGEKDLEKPENQIITTDMKTNYPEVIEITFDESGQLVPIIKSDAIKVSMTLYLSMLEKEGRHDLASLFGTIFGENNEISAIIDAQQDMEINYALEIDAQVSIQNLILPLLTGSNISLAGTKAKITLRNDGDNTDKIAQLTFMGGTGKNGNDEVFIKLFGMDKSGAEPKDISIVVDTINIMDVINSITGGGESALSTASATDSIFEVIGSLIKSIEIAPYSEETTGFTSRVININFEQYVFDNIIKLVAILTAGNGEVEKILDIIDKINLPKVTSGGLYLEYRTDSFGIGAGLDVEFNNEFNLELGLEFNGINVINKGINDKEEDILPDHNVDNDNRDNNYGYSSIGDLKLALDFTGYVDINNTNNNKPISLGSLITNILGLLNVNIGDVDFDMEMLTTEKYWLQINGYLDMNDFKLDDNGNTPNIKNTALKIDIKKGATGSATLLSAYLDINTDSAMVDLSGLNLPKIKLVNMGLVDLIANYISPYIGGKAPQTTAVANADNNTPVTFNKVFASMLYVSLGPDAVFGRFNANLINALLSFILGQITIDMDLSGLQIPDFGWVTIGSYPNNEDKAFEIKIHRGENDNENYTAIGVKSAGVSVGNNKDANIFNVNPSEYATIYDLKSGLKLSKIGIDAKMTLTVDFDNDEANAHQFSNYISRLLARLIDGDESYANKYSILISGNPQILQYELVIKGILDINDIFGGSNLAIELWKKDMAHNTNHNKILGVYLRNDEESGLPTIYADLAGLGLPKIKLVGIDSLLGGLSLGEAMSTAVLGTGDYATATAYKDDACKGNKIKFEDGKLTISITKGFIYGFLSALLPDVFMDGYISVGNVVLPLPNIKGVEVGIDLNKVGGGNEIDLKAYLESGNDNHLGINIALNDVYVYDVDANVNTIELPWGDTLDNAWNSYTQPYDSYENHTPNNTVEFGEFGSVHISTSFVADMVNAIVEGINPDLLLKYNKRSDGAYRDTGYQSGYSSAFARANNSSWANARLGQSWNEARIRKAAGDKAQALLIDIVTRSGAFNSYIDTTHPWTGETWNESNGMGYQALMVRLSNGEISLDLSKATNVTKDLSGISIIKNLYITTLNIGDMISAGSGILTGWGKDAPAAATSFGAMATADNRPSNKELSDIFTDLQINELLQGIEITIHTGDKTNSGEETLQIADNVDSDNPDERKYAGDIINKNTYNYAFTQLKVKVDPLMISDLFRAINYLLAGVLNSNAVDKTGKWTPWTIEDANSAPKAIYGAFLKFLLDQASILERFINDNLNGLEHNLSNLLSALLPLPTLNTWTDNVNMQAVAELNINLDFNNTGSNVLGALRSITANFGSNYGFGTYEGNGSDPNRAITAIGQTTGKYKLGKDGKNADKYIDYEGGFRGGNYDGNYYYPDALGYVNLQIGAFGDTSIGMKSVKTINDYSYVSGNNEKLKNLSEKYIESAAESGVESGGADLKDGGDEGINLSDKSINSPEDLHNELRTYIRANLPAAANVTFTDGTSTGTPYGGESGMITVVWDDSRVKLNINGNGLDEGSYLYGWVQNKMIAKIKVSLGATNWKLDKIAGYSMTNNEHNAFVSIGGNVINGKLEGTLNMNAYVTKDLPNMLRTSAVGVNQDRLYFTTAIKEHKYSYIVGGQTKYVLGKEGEHTDKTDEGFTGRWYRSRTSSQMCAGKLVWDTSMLSWSLTNPYALNPNAGNGTVTAKLINGVMDDYVISDIKVNLTNKFTLKDALKRKFGDKLEFDIADGILDGKKDIFNFFNNIGTLDGENLVLTNEIITVKFEPQDVSVDLRNLNDWLINTDNTYGGTTLKIPITLRRRIINPAVDGGMEEISETIPLTVRIKKLDLVDGKLSGSSGASTNIRLSPYKDFRQQLLDMFINAGKTYKLNANYRSLEGMLDAKLFDITADSFNMSSNAFVKFDIKSLYDTYSYAGGTTYIKVYVGSGTYGYQTIKLPVTIVNETFSNTTSKITIDKEINPLNTDTIKNADDIKGMQLKINSRLGGGAVNVLDILWIDKETIFNNIGKQKVSVNAIVGYKQQDEMTCSKYVTQNVTLIVNIANTQNVRIRSFNGKMLARDAEGRYILKNFDGVSKGTLVYWNGTRDIAIENVSLHLTPTNRTATYSIGLYDFTFVADDNVTTVSSIKANGVRRKYDVNQDGSYTVKFGFTESLPDKITIVINSPKYNEKGEIIEGVNIIEREITLVDVFDNPDNINKKLLYKEGTLHFGVFTIKVVVTK